MDPSFCVSHSMVGPDVILSNVITISFSLCFIRLILLNLLGKWKQKESNPWDAMRCHVMRWDNKTNCVLILPPIFIPNFSFCYIFICWTFFFLFRFSFSFPPTANFRISEILDIENENIWNPLSRSHLNETRNSKWSCSNRSI